MLHKAHETILTLSIIKVARTRGFSKSESDFLDFISRIIIYNCIFLLSHAKFG